MQDERAEWLRVIRGDRARQRSGAAAGPSAAGGLSQRYVDCVPARKRYLYQVRVHACAYVRVCVRARQCVLVRVRMRVRRLRAGPPALGRQEEKGHGEE
jgi:hypothetical protein